MRIIISPAKKMKEQTELFETKLPQFLKETEELKTWLQSKNSQELQKLWKCNDAITRQNMQRLSNMDLQRRLTPAILSYEGIQYQYMAPLVFEEKSWNYIQEHLRILSGFYGILRPLDGVTPYRLEMQAKVSAEGYDNLSQFWGTKLADSLAKETDFILNLASREYARAVFPHLPERVSFVTCAFMEEQKGKLVQKGTYAKMARGEMVRLLAEAATEDPEEIKGFSPVGYVYREELSEETQWIYVKEKEKTDETIICGIS